MAMTIKNKKQIMASLLLVLLIYTPGFLAGKNNENRTQRRRTTTTPRPITGFDDFGESTGNASRHNRDNQPLFIFREYVIDYLAESGRYDAKNMPSGDITRDDFTADNEEILNFSLNNLGHKFLELKYNGTARDIDSNRPETELLSD